MPEGVRQGGVGCWKVNDGASFEGKGQQCVLVLGVGCWPKQCECASFAPACVLTVQLWVSHLLQQVHFVRGRQQLDRATHDRLLVICCCWLCRRPLCCAIPWPHSSEPIC